MTTTGPRPPTLLTVDRIIAGAALLVATGASLLTLGTALMSKFAIWNDASGHFEARIGQLLVRPGLIGLSTSVVALALLVSTGRRAWPVLSFVSAALSVAAIYVCLTAHVEYRRNLDPRPALAKELASFDLGADATVVLRTSRPLPDLPSVRWVYRVPLRRAEACARARAAISEWADPNSLSESRDYPCEGLYARRTGNSVTVRIAPEGAPLTRGPTLREAVGDAAVHHVMVEIHACTGAAVTCGPPL